MATHVFIAGERVSLLSSVQIKRSASNNMCTATFQTPIDYLTEAKAKASVEIYKSGVTYFLGIITSYSLSYAGKVISLSLTCSDLSYKLAHSLIPLTATEAATLTYGSPPVAAMIDRCVFYWDGPIETRTYVKAGDAVEALLTGTGIYHSAFDYSGSPETEIEYIGLRDVEIPSNLYVFEPGKTRLDAIKAWAEALGAVFYVKFIGKFSVFVFDTYTNLVASTTNLDFNTTIAVSDSSHLIKSFNLVSVPENMYTRCTEEINDYPSTQDWYADETARDAYYTAHPTELIEGLYVQIGIGDEMYVQLYTSSAWIDYPIHAESISPGATAPYNDKFIEIDYDSGTIIETDVAAQLDSYELITERSSIDMVGAPAELYNILNLTGLYSDMGITVDKSSWRISELTLSVSAGSVTTQAALIDTTIPKVGSKVTAATYSVPEMIQKTTASAVNSGATRTATIDNIDTDKKVITIKYPGNQKEDIKIPGRSTTLPTTAYTKDDVVAVAKLAGGNKVLIPIFTQTMPLVAGDAIFAGGYYGDHTAMIDTITISTLGNATEFGDLSVSRYGAGACSSSTRGVIAGGHAITEFDVIDYVTMATCADATDFGNLTLGRFALAGLSNSTRGIFGGGHTTTYSDVIDYITIDTTGNATDFGNLTVARNAVCACSSPTRGIFAGGKYASYANIIEYVTIDTTGNATDFGDLTMARNMAASCSSSTRGIFGGGMDSGTTDNNIIDYITIATTGNATDFGDLSAKKYATAAVSNSTRGVISGGYNTESAAYLAVMDYVTIATTGNASDFGDLMLARYGSAGCSTNHGGIS